MSSQELEEPVRRELESHLTFWGHLVESIITDFVL